MSEKTFSTISKKECATVYKEILINSNKKWNAAEKLAEIGDFGGAISLSIISIEELIKSLLIYLDGKGFEFRNVAGMDVFFKNHQIRYIIAYIMLVVSLFGEDIIKHLLDFRENSAKYLTIKEEVTKPDFIEAKMKYYILRKFVQMKRELEWFSKVDKLRQNGFYSGYDNKLFSPVDLGAEDYKEVVKRLAKVRFVGNEFIKSIEMGGEHIQKIVSDSRRDFKRNKHYAKIEKALKNITKQRESPFDLFKKIFK